MQSNPYSYASVSQEGKVLYSTLDRGYSRSGLGSIMIRGETSGDLVTFPDTSGDSGFSCRTRQDRSGPEGLDWVGLHPDWASAIQSFIPIRLKSRGF